MEEHATMKRPVHNVTLLMLAASLSGAALAQTASAPQKPKAAAAAAARPTAAPTPQARPAAGSKGLSRNDFLNGRGTEFSQMDGNRDGSVTELEMVSFKVKQADAEAIGRNRAAFAALDTDKNGYISAAEFGASVRPTPLPDVKPLINALDADHNGAVSVLEYRTAMAAQFDRMDRNRDGTVDPSEVAPRPSAPAMTR